MVEKATPIYIPPSQHAPSQSLVKKIDSSRMSSTSHCGQEKGFPQFLRHKWTLVLPFLVSSSLNHCRVVPVPKANCTLLNA